MKNSISSNQLTIEMFVQENVEKQNNDIPNPITELEARIAELEHELKKQRAAAEKGAKLMQIIWGDKFESDSLH